MNLNRLVFLHQRASDYPFQANSSCFKHHLYQSLVYRRRTLRMSSFPLFIVFCRPLSQHHPPCLLSSRWWNLQQYHLHPHQSNQPNLPQLCRHAHRISLSVIVSAWHCPRHRWIPSCPNRNRSDHCIHYQYQKSNRQWMWNNQHHQCCTNPFNLNALPTNSHRYSQWNVTITLLSLMLLFFFVRWFKGKIELKQFEPGATIDGIVSVASNASYFFLQVLDERKDEFDQLAKRLQ